MLSFLPECVDCRRILGTICDCIDRGIPFDLILQFYYDHQAMSHNDERDIPLYRAVFYQTGKPGARE